MTSPPTGVSLLRTGILGVCPRCNKGSIFKNPVAFRDTCPACAFDITSHDNGDGPAFFVITIVGFLVTGLAAWVEFTFTPPFWLHAILWGPMILIASLLLLRVFKGMLLASQVKYHLLGDPDDKNNP